MKEDYKEEAKRFLGKENIEDHEIQIGKVVLLSNPPQIPVKRISEIMSNFHKYQLSETRYHPDTLEPVEKPVECGECDGINKPINPKCGACWGTDYSIIWNNALTLEQVFERYKEMNSCQCRCSCM